MARVELRYLDEAKTQQEMVVLCTASEYTSLGAKAGELTHKYYQEGVAETVCNAEWAEFRIHLFGWSLAQRIEEVEREGVSVRFITDGDTGPH